MNTQPLSTTQELADYFQVSTRTIHNWVNNGTEPCVIAFILISSDGNTATG